MRQVYNGKLNSSFTINQENLDTQDNYTNQVYLG